jgi:hypothetical protein
MNYSGGCKLKKNYKLAKPQTANIGIGIGIGIPANSDEQQALNG